MITTSELEAELHALLGMIHKLSPHSYHPDRFHEQKDDLARFVASLITRSCGRSKSVHSFAALHADAGATYVCLDGRMIPVERRKATASPRR